MKIHDENSQMVRIPDLRKGMVVEPGHYHVERVTIEGTPEVVKEEHMVRNVWGRAELVPALYCVLGKLDDGTVISSHSYIGDAVWVLP